MASNNYRNDMPPPGHFIKKELDARDWSQRDLAWLLDMEESNLNPILNGKRGITPIMAKTFGEAFDVHPDLFINLQKAYDMARTPEPDPAVAKKARLQSAYPVRDMIMREWLTDTNVAMLEDQMASFFEVNEAGKIPHIQVHAKKTNSEEKPPAQLAWLFRVRQIAKSITVPKYSEAKLRKALDDLRALIWEPEEVRHVPRILAECGVRYILVEGLPNGKVDGVCFWLGKQPVIGMSLRYDRVDNFWFVLRHEIEHVLQKHGQEEPIIDAELEGELAGDSPSIPDEERVSNVAAADFCVPSAQMKSFIARKSPFFSERDIIGFAKRLQVHPGLVVGQIQTHTQRYNFLRKHLVKVRHLVTPSAIVDGWGTVAPVSL